MNTQPRHPKCRALPVEPHPDIQFLPLYHGGGENQRFFCLWSFLWSKPFLCRFRQPGEIQQTQSLQGFAAFRLAPSRIRPRHSQSRRATNCATPGYSVFYPAGRILPNQARYQLRYTQIKIRRPLPGGVSTIPAFSSACKGKICLGAFCIPEAFSPCRITAPAPPSARPPDRSFPKPRPGPPGPYGRRPPAYDRWAFADPDRG